MLGGLSMLQLEEYTLGETLYEGPETRVQRALHRLSGEHLVVKMPVSSTPSLRITGRLIHEHQILSRLTHLPGVAKPWKLEQRGGSAVLMLKDAGLRSLHRLLAEHGRLPVAAALRLAVGLCRVLQGVHAAGIMHKDIKPQNILVDETCTEVVLVDFGIASELAQEAAEASLPEALEGSLAYISPEQTGRTARGLDARTDLYSLGVVLFEALSGRQPFLEKDALALVYAHLAKAPPAVDGLVPDVPAVIGRILERCLEKHPESRYQSAKGLAADLEQALEQWVQRGQIEAFPLGKKDFSPKLQIPQLLVSRETECRAITAAFERVADGAVEVLLLGGPSGAGKTALVRSVYQEIAKAGRGLLLSGKHDQVGRSVPHAALVQAFGGLMNMLAASPKPVFEAWRARIERALGPLARVIADLVPELEWLTGPLPPIPVPNEMAYNRFRLSWIEFVRTVTEASPPLVLFLDDMQWSDPASLELLKTLLTDIGCKHLLIIAAYRDNEVGPGHPLWKLVQAVEASGVKAPRLAVGPLDDAAVQAWLAATLSATPARVAPLAAALRKKTDGNPFFLGQLLLELHRQGRVFRDLDHGTWEWEQDAVERAAVTDNVVELMRSKIVELPQETAALLGQAACAGHSFSLTELIVLTGLGPAEVTRALRPALQAGLVIPQDGQYREAQALAQTTEAGEMDAGYRFLHDRVQQACYERIPLPQRARTHLGIGRRLHVVFEREGGSDQKLLELARHLNLGAGALTSEEERKDLARIDLRAAKAAKANGSYRLQATLVEQAQALLGEHAWQQEPELSTELALERIEADYMLREFAEVHRGALAFLARPLPTVPRLAAQELRVRTCVASGEYDEGERLGLATIAEHGIHYPDTNEQCIALARQLVQQCDAWLDQHPNGLANLPADPSVEHLLIAALEISTAACASYGSRSALMTAIIARNVRQATERGNLTIVTPFFLATFAHARSTVCEDYRGAVRWARAGEQAATRLGSPSFPECATFRAIYEGHETPIEQTRERYQVALRAAVASGSRLGTSWGLACPLYYIDMWGGRPLGQVAEMERTQRDVMVRAGDMTGQQMLALIADISAFLRNPLTARPAVGQEWLASGSRALLAAGAPFIAQFARIQESYLFLAFDEVACALERAEEAEQLRTDLYGLFIVTDIPLWRGLAAAKSWSPTLPAPEQEALRGKLTHSISRFVYFTQGCAENFGHKLRLLEAEHARIQGRSDDALSAYEDAIEQAHTQGFLHIEALAAQLCADFHLAKGRKRLAASYLRQARSAYARWDAQALVAHLEAKHSTLLLAPEAPDAHAASSSATIGATGEAVLDIRTTVHAAQALSSELDPDRVVARIMQLVKENAGAQRAVLLRAREDKLSVAALLSSSQVRVGLAESISASHPIAHSVVEFVVRTREIIILSDTAADSRFANDPHFRNAAIRSVIAVPLLHQGRLEGLLYLEHDAANAFPPARVTLLGVLATQSAIALENAQLYADLRAQIAILEARNQEVQRLNEELRYQIEQRSRALFLLLSPRNRTQPFTAGLQAGDRLGERYVVVRPLGAGGMGAVYEVERLSDGLHLAAKVLKTTPEPTALSRFAREAQILARLNHPNLISIADVDVTPAGILYIVMDLVDGKALAQRRDRFGELRWSLSVLRQVAAALATLHAGGIVHRDLKPENVLVIQESAAAPPTVKLVDFGIALLAHEERQESTPVTSPEAGAELVLAMTETPKPSSALHETPALGMVKTETPRPTPLRENHLTETGQIIGTPFYIAPELLHGSQQAQPAADLFSFGVLAFELLSGRLPFMRPAVELRAFGEPILVPDVLRKRAEIPPPVADLIERCLQADPDERPSAAQVVQALVAAS